MTGHDVLAVAAREIGYREGPDRDNKFGRWFGLNRQPWCMEFVQWCYAEAGAPLPLKTASCGALLNWYRAHQPACVTTEPVPGCIVIFDFPGRSTTDHTGLFVSRTETTVTTIDGNTSGMSNDNGGWVQQRTRTLHYANPTYIVPQSLRQEGDTAMRYNTLQDIREGAPWAAATVEKLIDVGAIRGGGARDAQGRPADLDLSGDMLRLLVICDRAGALGGPI